MIFAVVAASPGSLFVGYKKKKKKNDIQYLIRNSFASYM